MIMAEPVELLAKISRSAAQIILDAIAVHSQRGSRPGHQLGQAEGVLGRQRIGAIAALDRKSVVSGKSVSVRVDLGGRSIIKKKNTQPIVQNHETKDHNTRTLQNREK